MVMREFKHLPNDKNNITEQRKSYETPMTKEVDEKPLFGETVGRCRFWERLLFHTSGKPRKVFRRLLFHNDGRPRSIFRCWVLRSNGMPRRLFRRWMSSSVDSVADAALPSALSIGDVAIDLLSPRTHYFLKRLETSQTARTEN